MPENIFDIELDGRGYMLGEGGSSVATVNNPPGLRTTGGNILREYAQWTEEEWNDFARGAGMKSASDSGFLHSSGDTLRGGWRLGPSINKGEFAPALGAGSRHAGGCFFAEYHDILLVGAGRHLRYFRRNPSTYAPERLNSGDITFTIDEATDGYGIWPGRSWFMTNAANSYFPFEGGTIVTVPPLQQQRVGATIKTNYVIRGMAVYGDYLALVLVDTVDAPSRPLHADAPDIQTPNTDIPVGIYLIDLKPLGAASPSAPTADLRVGSTGYFAFRTGITAEEPDARLDKNYRYEAVGCAVYDGMLWFWMGDTLFYSPGDLHEDTRAGLTASPPLGSNPELYAASTSVAYWAWYAVPLPSGARHSLSLWRDADGVLGAPYEAITGMVSLQGMTVQEKVVYVATTHGLYALLAGDVWSFMAHWDSVNWWNGMNPVEHAGDAYFPVGTGLWRVTSTGQLVRMGLNTLPVQPHRAAERHGLALCSIGGRLLAMSEAPYATDQAGVAAAPGSPPFNMGEDSNIITRVWAYDGQGWHPVASRHPNDSATDTAATTTLNIDPHWMWQAQGMYYQPGTQTLWFATGNGHVSNTTNVGLFRGVHLWCLTVTESPGLMDAGISPFQYRYHTRGWLVLPPFDAGAVTLKKDWESIAVYGRCFSPGSSIYCYYRRTAGIAAAQGCELTGVHYADAGWTLLEAAPKTFTTTAHGLLVWEFSIPRGWTEGSEAIEIKFLVVRGLDNLTLSPVIEAIRLQHHDYIRDYYRFNLNISLPGKCLTDVCGVEVAGYHRNVYDGYIRAAVCKTVPVKFVDVDGQEFYVRVESASRRATNLGFVPTSGQRNLDITWNIALTEIHPDSICDIVGVSPLPS